MIDLAAIDRVDALLASASDLPRTTVIAFARGTQLALDDRCVVFDEDELGPDEDAPAAVVEAGLTRVLGAEQLQDIVVNASMQVGDPGTDQLLEALNYYLDNDAFISF